MRTSATFSWRPPPIDPAPPSTLEDLFSHKPGELPPAFGVIIGLVYFVEFSTEALFDAALLLVEVTQ